MRTLSSAALAALAGSPVPIAVLVEMDLTTQLLLNNTTMDLTINSTVYTGVGALGKIDDIQETAAEVKPLQFTFSGARSENISLALQEPVQGKAVRIKFAIFDPATYQLLDVRLRWSGVLDVMSIDDGNGRATITVSGEHAGIDLLRPYASLYSDSEQRRLHPGDLAFQFNADQVEQRIVWPAASWGRQ